MSKPLTPAEALHRAAALCSTTEHCTADICEKLTRWGISANDSRTIIERLVSERFIDESRYAVAFVKDKFRFAGWGRIKIRYALQQKRINNSDIVEALTTIDEEQYLDRLASLLQDKNKTIHDDNPESRKAKLCRFAASRGFETDLIFRQLKTIDL